MSVGIIAEYNPFHNGHLYHLNEVKKMFPNETIILVMNGPFSQRGECSIINKWDKTKIALEMGIDLIIELPFPFATQSADIFGKGSVDLLNYLKVDYLVFGSESDNIDNLKELASIQLNDKSYDERIKKYLDEGINYPTALAKGLKDITDIDIKKPNDILGISYIKEIIKLDSKMKPLTIKRTNDYHSLELDNEIVSASSIRNGLESKLDISKYVPNTTLKYMHHLHFIDDYFTFLKYKILTEDDLSIYQTVDEGIENRIKKYIIKCNTLEELVSKVKTKRYTYNKIMRMLTHILCNFTKEEAKDMKEIEYIRVLGFSDKGQFYLNKIKKDVEIPIITNYSSLKSKMLDLEFRVSCIYASTLNDQDKLLLIENEYKHNPKNIK